MATIKTITIEYAYTFNLGNYSSVKPAVSFTAELVEGDLADEVMLALQEKAREAVHDEIDRELVRAGKQPHFRPAPDEDLPF